MIRTDDNAPLHPKFQIVGLAAYGWWHAAVSYAGRQMTDGFLRAKALPHIFPAATPDELVMVLDVLVREGCLHRVDRGQKPACHHPSKYCPTPTAPEDGYVIHDYFEFQQRARDVRHIRAERIKAGRKGGENSWKTRKQVAEPSAERFAEPHTVPNHTEPIRTEPETLITKAESPERPATAAPVPLNGHIEPARAVLAFLNQRAGRAFRPVPSTLRLIAARLKEGASVEDCKGVIVRKVRQWGADPKMADYLRPETLFNATKFASYIGEQGRPS